jgi:hypothetical protein
MAWWGGSCHFTTPASLTGTGATRAPAKKKPRQAGAFLCATRRTLVQARASLDAAGLPRSDTTSKLTA